MAAVVFPRSASRSRRRRTGRDHVPRVGRRRRRPAAAGDVAELHDDARAMAAALQARGVEPGAHVAILGPTTRPLVTAIQATWLCGAATVMLPLPMRLGIDRRVRRADARPHPRVRRDARGRRRAARGVPRPRSPATRRSCSLDALDVGAPAPATRTTARPTTPNALAILQYTSGSTSDPRGVILPHRCVTANADAIVQRGAPRGRRRPRGVVAAAVPRHGPDRAAHDPDDDGHGPRARRAAGLPRRARAVDAVVRRVRRHRERGPELRLRARGPRPAPARPPRSLGLAARAQRRRARRSRRRRALRRGRARGTDSRGSAVFPAFGMAEATLAVTFPEPGSGLTVDVIDGRVLENEKYAAPVAPEHGTARAAGASRPARTRAVGARVRPRRPNA